MERWWLWLNWVVLAFHVVAILIFTRGFLLTRTELPHHSQCSDVLESSCFFSGNASSGSSPSLCWTRPVVDRVVIVVIDALRFDFVAPSACFPERKPWMNKLSILQQLAVTSSSSARIFKAIADPPTTSLQRLKGLTTGGLPTFIDVGNSFGSPAIVEDNFIHQLVVNGKRVVMMGDDTWVQLFPHHFNKSYPYPSFNVKDLHTVDNGCIDNLFPSLLKDDWNVLIAHFLGVDHAGHIFGVDSMPMMDKLEQYNFMLEKVISVLEGHSETGDLHENTFLIVMGDHGQTINGDHGGGSAEEVETSIFAMRFKKPPHSIPSKFDGTSCSLDLDCKKMNISSIKQLDFTVTLSALLGVPYPFGSIGSVNPELYALGAGVSKFEGTKLFDCRNQSELADWLQNYVNALCINCWQVKRYIDAYSASSLIGFSSEDLVRLSDAYIQAEKIWANSTKNLLMHKNESCQSLLPSLTEQIHAYFNFLSNVSELAHSKWTEFDLQLMAIGLVIMLASHMISAFAVYRMNDQQVFSSFNSENFFQLMFVLVIVAIRFCSLFSNSFILEEGKVCSFLLATTSILRLRCSISRKRKIFEAIILLVLISFLRFMIDVGLSKQAVTSLFMDVSSSWVLGIDLGHRVWIYVVEIGSILSLIFLAFLLYRTIGRNRNRECLSFVVVGTILSYILIALYWGSQSSIKFLAQAFQGFNGNFVPRIVYAVGIGQLLLVLFVHLFGLEFSLNYQGCLVGKTLALLFAWSSSIIILSGKQGAFITIASVIGGYCIVKLASVEEENMIGRVPASNLVAIAQWHLFASCLFFSTGHWCAFDGLHYGAAFVGFDDFSLIPQAILLLIDTFGFSHILPIFGLPFLALHPRRSLFSHLSQVYVIYGLIMAIMVTSTIVCVTIQRRHLMVWGLFAPKFVFDAAGLVLTDLLICTASMFYGSPQEDAGATSRTMFKRKVA